MESALVHCQAREISPTTARIKADGASERRRCRLSSTAPIRRVRNKSPANAEQRRQPTASTRRTPATPDRAKVRSKSILLQAKKPTLGRIGFQGADQTRSTPHSSPVLDRHPLPRARSKGRRRAGRSWEGQRLVMSYQALNTVAVMEKPRASTLKLLAGLVSGSRSTTKTVASACCGSRRAGSLSPLGGLWHVCQPVHTFSTRSPMVSPPYASGPRIFIIIAPRLGPRSGA